MKAFLTQFDLREAQVLSLLESLTGSRLVGFEVLPSAAENTHGDDKQFANFRCLLPNGGTVEKTVFVKKCVWESRSEAVHYRYLAAAGVPTPRLLGAASNASGAEIIFLEPVTAIGFQEDSEAEWREMLSLLARFNACPLTPEYASHLRAYAQVGQIGQISLLDLDAEPDEEEADAGFKAGGADESELPKLKQALKDLSARIEAQPKGLLHQDFLPNNFGWRGEREDMVVFDLQKNCFGPRFADAAFYLGLPDWSGRTAFLDHSDLDRSDGEAACRDRLIRHYLEEYARCGGAEVAPETFRAETSALSWAHKAASLWWLVESKHDAQVQTVLRFLASSAPARL